MLLEHLLWISIRGMVGGVIRDVRKIRMEGVCPANKNVYVTGIVHHGRIPVRTLEEGGEF